MSVHSSSVSKGLSATWSSEMLQTGDSNIHPTMVHFPHKFPLSNCSSAAMESSSLVHGRSKCRNLLRICWSVSIGEQFSFSRAHWSRNRAKQQLLQSLPSSGTSMWGNDLVICLRPKIPSASVLGMAVCCISLNFHSRLVIFATSFIK
jgi:hypothetical protein